MSVVVSVVATLRLCIDFVNPTDVGHTSLKVLLGRYNAYGQIDVARSYPCKRLLGKVSPEQFPWDRAIR